MTDHVERHRGGGARRRTAHRAVAYLTAAALGVGMLSAGGALARDDVAQAAVPVPAAGQAIISVKVGGDRQPSGTVAGLAGLRLSLYGAGTATTNGQATVQGTPGARYDPAWSWATCISDADGDCNFVIPIRAGAVSATGVPQDTRFWVAQDPSDAAPAGYFSNPQVRLGGPGAAPEFTWGYRFRTDTQLRAGTVYSSTAPMTASASYLNADLGFMRNRVDANTEGLMGENIGRSTGVWSQSRINPALAASCGLRVAVVADTSGSLGTAGMAAITSAIGAFADAFVGTPTTMSLYSFSTISPGTGAANFPTPLPVTTTAQAAAFKAQYAGWTSIGGTSWDRGLAAVANSGHPYDLVVMLTDGNPTVFGASPGPTASAFNSFEDVDAGIFSANQLKARGSRVVAVGAGPALTSASDLNLRAVSGANANSDYFRVADFAAAEAVLAQLARANCEASIEVQKKIVPAGGTVAQATPAPAGWQFDAVSQETTKVAVSAPGSATTTATSNGTVDFGLEYTSPATDGLVRVTEVQQSGFALLPVGGANATCVDADTGAAIPVTDVVDAAHPGFTVESRLDTQIICTVYNTPAAPRVSLTKALDGPRRADGDQFTVAIRSGGPTGPVVSSAGSATTTGAGSTVASGTGTTGVYTATAGTAYSLGEAASGTAVLADYTATITCTDAAGLQTGLPDAAPFDPASPPSITPVAGADIACVITNTAKPVVGSVAWRKVDASPAKNLLSGAAWTVTPLDSSGQPSGTAVVVTDCVAATAALCTGADADPAGGRFLLTGLAPGDYRLVETKAPVGYVLDPTPVTVTIASSAPAVTLADIVNHPQSAPALPLTGGVGVDDLLLGGGGLLALMLALAIWHLIRRRRTA
ncbi:VWA domain-containing protein [Leifsonia aquatica]|uniref:VWA domain-containing protein n=1 Tax=Leifsonia aquatica TaxID=144185 RepID=UPI00384FD412